MALCRSFSGAITFNESVLHGHRQGSANTITPYIDYKAGEISDPNERETDMGL